MEVVGRTVTCLHTWVDACKSKCCRAGELAMHYWKMLPYDPISAGKVSQEAWHNLHRNSSQHALPPQNQTPAGQTFRSTRNLWHDLNLDPDPTMKSKILSLGTAGIRSDYQRLSLNYINWRKRWVENNVKDYSTTKRTTRHQQKLVAPQQKNWVPPHRGSKIQQPIKYL